MDKYSVDQRSIFSALAEQSQTFRRPSLIASLLDDEEKVSKT
jgi:hypothetical protein